MEVLEWSQLITDIPKGTPARTIANIAYVAIEDAKVVSKMASGELSMKEGIDKIDKIGMTTIATVAGLTTMGQLLVGLLVEQ